MIFSYKRAKFFLHVNEKFHSICSNSFSVDAQTYKTHVKLLGETLGQVVKSDDS